MRSIKVSRGLVLVACAVVLLMAAVVIGQSIKNTQADTGKAAAPAKQLKSQTTCPVTGDKIDKNQYVDHNGKRIYVCCPDCLAQVKKNPEKNIKKLESQGQSVESIEEGAMARNSLAIADTSAKKMNVKATRMTGDTAGTSAEGAYWTCTMHPEIHKGVSGKCPICKMKLELKENTAADKTKTKSRDTTTTKSADSSKMRM